MSPHFYWIVFMLRHYIPFCCHQLMRNVQLMNFEILINSTVSGTKN